MSAEESAQIIIDNWNRVVHKKDVVYVLGDIVMEEPKLVEQYIKQLKGQIYVVGGNHDTRQVCNKLTELNIPVMGCVQYKGYICTHIPIQEHETHFFKGNIHGHIHLKGKIDNMEYNPTIPQGRYFNVNCEFHDYTPVPFEKIEKYFQSLGENS
jgi:calcineurin-like phosphoesterase family protein